MATTTIDSLLDAQILKKGNTIIALQDDILQLQNAKVEYGDDIIISVWQQFKSSDGFTRVMIVNLDRFPLVGIKYLESKDISPSDISARSTVPEFVDYNTVFKPFYPVFCESIREQQ